MIPNVNYTHNRAITSLERPFGGVDGKLLRTRMKSIDPGKLRSCGVSKESSHSVFEVSPTFCGVQLSDRNREPVFRKIWSSPANYQGAHKNCPVSISANGSDTDSLTAPRQHQRYAEHFLLSLCSHRRRINFIAPFFVIARFQSRWPPLRTSH